MNEYKLFVQRIGLIGVTNILISLSSIIFIPIITKSFSTGDYGIWVQVNTTIALIPNIANLGLPFTMVRFLSAERDKTKIKESFYSMMVVVFVSSILISLFLIIFANPIAKEIFGGNVDIVYLVSMISFFASINLMLISFFRTFQQIKKYSLFLVLQTYIGVIISSYFVIIGCDLFTVVLGYSVGFIMVFIAMGIMIVGYLGIALPKFKNLKEELNFAIPTIPNNVSSWVVDSSDKYIIGLFLSTSAVGYYSPSYALGSILLMFLSPFAILLPSMLPKFYEAKDYLQVDIFLRYSLKYFLVLTIPAGFGLSLLSKQILLIISTPEIAINGYLVSPFVCLGAIFMGIYGIVNNILILEKNTKILGTIWTTVAILNIIFNMVAVPYLGIIGASFVTLLCYILAFAVTSFYARKYAKLPFDYNSIMKIIISAIAMGIFIFVVNPQGILNVLIVVLISIAIYFLFLFGINGINPKEFKFFKEMLKS
jgi:O-antigen/teichoic acid export membrane protein